MIIPEIPPSPMWSIMMFSSTSSSPREPHVINRRLLCTCTIVDVQVCMTKSWCNITKLFFFFILVFFHPLGSRCSPMSTPRTSVGDHWRATFPLRVSVSQCVYSEYTWDSECIDDIYLMSFFSSVIHKDVCTIWEFRNWQTKCKED